MNEGARADYGGGMRPDADETPEGRIASPCVRLCVIHPDAGLCTGCLRTIDEITAWTRFSEKERREIMASLPERAPFLRQRRGGRAGRLARARTAETR